MINRNAEHVTMKQLAQYQDGRLEIQEVAPPTVPPGGILVRVTHSVISPGTEKMKMAQARMNLLQKARARPDQVRKVMSSVRTLGWKSALEKVKNRLESPEPLGYCAAGEVIAVHPDNTRFRVGDRVACGGAECANHAEIIAIPDLLAARIPDGVENWQAAYTTLASIALHAVRQSDIRAGERAVVFGQGLVGLLVTGILVASGCEVLALDPVPSRLETAKQMGAKLAGKPSDSSLSLAVQEWTQHMGADTVFLCVGGGAEAAVPQAISFLRDRATLVIVGILDIELEWKSCFAKEIQVRYARSYGPGRYDPGYEWGGRDYPEGYVRWTEQRNFEACLEWMRNGKLKLEPVTTRHAPFADALAVYDSLLKSSSDIGIVLHYERDAPCVGVKPLGDSGAGEPTLSESPKGLTPTAENPFRTGSKAKRAQPVAALDVLGAGNFARTMLLPYIRDHVTLGTIVNRTPLSAAHVQKKFGFQASLTDSEQLFQTAADHAVIISTRHHLHAELVKRSLESGRDVFVEKPLCLSREELTALWQTLHAPEVKGRVMVGFNRRFAPASVWLKERLNQRGPLAIAYHVNAGRVQPDHWYANLEESGGRVIGEACHFLDWFCFLTGSKPARVFAQPLGQVGGKMAAVDSFSAQVEFADGSSAQLIYTANAPTSFPKETITVFGANCSAKIENFQKLEWQEGSKSATQKFSSKGHAEEMKAWADYLGTKGEFPLPEAESWQSMELTFAVQEAWRGG